MSVQTFIYKNTNISYTDEGKGVALVFLHGFLENKNLWKEVVPDFTSKHRVICVDLMGHGVSECLGYVHSMEDQADMVFALIHHLKLRKITLIGHSMGGYVALAFAELYPDVVKRLMLVNASSRADSDERKQNRNRAIEVVKKNATAFVSMAIQNLFSEEFAQHNQSKISAFKKEALQTPIQGILAAIEGMRDRIDREVLLHFSPYPVMILGGKNDLIVPLETLREECENNETQLVEMETGHISPLENPQKVSETLKKFLHQ